jgi:hypothetical protein
VASRVTLRSLPKGDHLDSESIREVIDLWDPVIYGNTAPRPVQAERYVKYVDETLLPLVQGCCGTKRRRELEAARQKDVANKSRLGIDDRLATERRWTLEYAEDVADPVIVSILLHEDVRRDHEA